ncbi:hypothetical protein A6A06_09490 [Streptomyces sp. CB02923]|uniref:hypothetical protein n=1 Tax=Streptomyces sp. CB02923 TaxID=1718985 RepID=UPI00093F8DB9|nr:hypothetical protein [Streptomyces sp. CB02923]OKI04919.1 hypothetical protein A6A06_09490 [Streptomyces sp. CB02923]
MTTHPSPSDPAAVAVELERLRSSVDVGFARVDGSLALLVQRSDQTDRAIADHESRLDALERNRWPLPSLAVLVSVVGAAVTIWTAAGR